ncbi:MAG: adenylosuccinate lyase [Bacteroidales bacterium]|nr:adenylosuccinate lyase [Bacteroidales bacterium]
MLTAISPIDGRYSRQTADLKTLFSEYALIRYRVWVEAEYLIALSELPIDALKGLTPAHKEAIAQIASQLSEADAERIKEIERTTNHDVKAVEYFIKERLDGLNMSQFREYVHFGLTSQDINNTAFPAMVRDAVSQCYLPCLDALTARLNELAEEWRNIPLLAHTHGQPASPTRLGKEIMVFVERLHTQREQLLQIPFSAKFGGATGNFNAHVAAFPKIDWVKFANNFVDNKLKLKRSAPTTQIEHYDNLAALFNAMARINTILIDFCRDIWTYISMEYFKQRIAAGEVGSSAMPHKVNPIDFENAEGNLGLANAILTHLAEKLPISRLQRDLTDSTVMRNIGVPFGHTIIALKSIQKGLNKLIVNQSAIAADLNSSWMVVAEGLQTILRREGYPNPYEALKALTRTNEQVGQAEIAKFIDDLDVSNSVKAELRAITPSSYLGVDF